MGMGNAVSCVGNEWSLFNNPGGLSKIKNTMATFTYEAHPSFTPFNRMASSLAIPSKFGVSAFGFYRFGDDLYNEQIISAAFANQLGLASLGLKVNYVQYHAEGFGTIGIFTFCFGGIAQLTPALSVGANILNIYQPTISQDSDEKVPTILTIGIGFKFSETLFVSTEIEKDLDHRVLTKAGLEYTIHKKLIARTGINLNPNAGFAGVGFKPKKFNLDYGYQYSITQGSIHQASVTYLLNSRK